MPTQPINTTRLLEAVELVRRYRHHQDCVCCLYRDPDGAGYCGVDECRWNAAVNRLLDVAVVCSVTVKARSHL